MHEAHVEAAPVAVANQVGTGSIGQRQGASQVSPDGVEILVRHIARATRPHRLCEGIARKLLALVHGKQHQQDARVLPSEQGMVYRGVADRHFEDPEHPQRKHGNAPLGRKRLGSNLAVEQRCGVGRNPIRTTRLALPRLVLEQAPLREHVHLRMPEHDERGGVEGAPFEHEAARVRFLHRQPRRDGEKVSLPVRLAFREPASHEALGLPQRPIGFGIGPVFRPLVHAEQPRCTYAQNGVIGGNGREPQPEARQVGKSRLARLPSFDEQRPTRLQHLITRLLGKRLALQLLARTFRHRARIVADRDQQAERLHVFGCRAVERVAFRTTHRPGLVAEHPPAKRLDCVEAHLQLALAFLFPLHELQSRKEAGAFHQIERMVDRPFRPIMARANRLDESACTRGASPLEQEGGPRLHELGCRIERRALDKTRQATLKRSGKRRCRNRGRLETPCVGVEPQMRVIAESLFQRGLVERAQRNETRDRTLAQNEHRAHGEQEI